MRNAKVIIVGAGPAGVAAAVQLKRYDIHPLIFERFEIGGLVREAHSVENYPGFPRGIPGPTLARLLEEHLKRGGIEPQQEEVLDVSIEGGRFSVKTSRGKVEADVVVIASGTLPKKFPGLRIPPEKKGLVHYHVHHLLHVSGKRIVIVGSGDAAFDYALNLSKKNEVVILGRGSNPRCLPILFKRAMENERITYLNGTHLKEVKWPGEDLTLLCERGGRVMKIETSHILFAIGREPNLSFLSEKVRREMDTLLRQKKLYLVGDVRCGVYRQATIAAGDGIRTAMEIYYHLRGGR